VNTVIDGSNTFSVAHNNNSKLIYLTRENWQRAACASKERIRKFEVSFNSSLTKAIFRDREK